MRRDCPSECDCRRTKHAPVETVDGVLTKDVYLVEVDCANKGLDHLPELKRSLQPTLDGPCVWIVQPAELLNEPLVSAMGKHSGWQTKMASQEYR